MINRSVIITIFFMLYEIAFSQNDSIHFIKNADISFYKFKKVKYDNSSDIQTEKYLTSLQDVIRIKVIENDSASLDNQDGITAYTRISNITQVTKYEYRLSPVLGTLLGILGGSLAGAGVTYLLPYNNAFDRSFTIIGGAIIGSVLGGFFGAGIAYAINHPTLDLTSVPEKDKKNKLMKFLNKK